MRKNYYIILFILFFFGCSTNDQDGVDPIYSDSTYGFIGVGSGIFSYSDGIWYEKAFPLNTFRNVKYVNKKYIAVGKSGIILISSDGDKWSSTTNSDSNTILDVTYGNNTYIAVGENGTILISSDALTWTTAASGLTNNGTLVDLGGVTYGNNTFIAVGPANYLYGYILTSSDGSSWTSRTSGTSWSLFDVIYANNIFIATGSGGTIISSSDGITWTSRTSGIMSTSHSGINITYGNNKFVGLAVDSGKNITTSSDGITWTPSTWYNSNGNSGITYGNGLYLASADENYGVSSDGTNWTYYSTGSTAISLESVVYGN